MNILKYRDFTGENAVQLCQFLVIMENVRIGISHLAWPINTCLCDLASGNANVKEK